MDREVKIGSADGASSTLKLQTLIESRALAIASSGGGKSWLLRLLAEQIAPHVPTIIIDPEGEFYTLREKIDLLLVAANGEIRPDIRTAALLARRITELRLSSVIDISELRLSDRRAYVSRFLNALIELPRSLWRPRMVFIDEAHLFCPERGHGEAESTGAVIDLMSRGRKRSLCGVLATQRISKLSKDAAAESLNMFIGVTSLDVDQKRAADVMGIDRKAARALREIKPLTFNAFGPALNHRGVALVKLDKVTTTHPKLGRGEAIKPPAPSATIKRALSEFADLERESDDAAKNLDDANETIGRLRRELAAVKSGSPIDSEATLARIQRLESDAESASVEILSLGGKVSAMKAATTAAHDAMMESAQRLIDAAGRLCDGAAVADAIPVVNVPIERRSAPDRKPAPSPGPVRGSGPNSSLRENQTRVLTAIVGGGDDGVTMDEIAVLTGYKTTQRYDVLRSLTALELIEKNGAKFRASGAGVRALPDFKPLPTGRALLEHYERELCDRDVEVMKRIHIRREADRQVISDDTGYKTTAVYDALRSLLARRIIVPVSKGRYRMADRFTH